MPLYAYKCSTCDEFTDSYNSVASRHNAPQCECGADTELSIQPTQIAPVLGGGGFQGYVCPVTSEWVTSRRKRKYITESNNLVEVGDRTPSKARQAQTESNRLNGIV